MGEMNGLRVRTVSTSLGEWISSGNEWSQSPCHPVSGSTCPGLAIGAWCGKGTAPGCAWCLRGAMLLRGFRLFGVALHWEPKGTKRNHFYSNKMHEHHILANRTACWSFDAVQNDKGKVIERTIAPSEDTRLRSATHETFATGFEDKYFASPGGRKEDSSYGKRKHSDSTGQARAKQFDPTNTYSARDMQAWDEAFADPTPSTTAPASQPRVPTEGVQWTYGQVPALRSGAKGSDRSTAQLAYARTLLSVVMEAAMQLETVVETAN